MQIMRISRTGDSLSKKKDEKKRDEEIDTEYISKMLMKGPMPELSRMSKAALLEECKMWRAVWSWVPSEVKYYVSRTGSMCGITMRNYKRYLGILLETHWTLDEIELGVYDKVYDNVSGQHYFERKVIKTRIGGIIDLQWIASRQTEAEVLGQTTPPTEEEVQVGLEDSEAKATQGLDET